MSNFKIINVPIYDAQIIVFVEPTPKLVKENLKYKNKNLKYSKEEIISLKQRILEDLYRSTNATVYSRSNSNLQAVVFKKPIKSCAVIAHEAFHLAIAILNYAGLHLSISSEEAYAYLLEYIFAEIEDML